MKIIIIGGTGLIGSKLVSKLLERGHDAVPASPDTGVNTISGEGLSDALAGADVVIDVSNSPSFEESAVLKLLRDIHAQPAGRRSPAAMNGLRAHIQEIEKARAGKKRADPPGRAGDSQDAVRGGGHVMRTNQFPETSCVDVRDRGEVEENSSLAVAQEGPDLALQVAAGRRAKSARDMKDRQAIERLVNGHRVQTRVIFPSVPRVMRHSRRIRTASCRP